MKEVATILIADDERQVRKAIAELLESQGYRVIAVRDGQMAVEAHRREAPDVVMLDVMMPRMNGHEACREIRKIDSYVPILFFTAFDGEVNELQGLGLGADDFISKTASVEKIVGRIAAAVRRVNRTESGNFLFGKGYVNAAACTYVEDGQGESRLTEREILLLRVFARQAGEVLSKEVIAKPSSVEHSGDSVA